MHVLWVDCVYFIPASVLDKCFTEVLCHLKYVALQSHTQITVLFEVFYHDM
jgi:hypothetical protein